MRSLPVNVCPVGWILRTIFILCYSKMWTKTDSSHRNYPVTVSVKEVGFWKRLVSGTQCRSEAEQRVRGVEGERIG